MPTIAAVSGRSGAADRTFFSTTAMVMLLAAFVGFAPSYYLSSLTGAPAVSPLVHLHAFVFSAWIILYVTQVSLVAGGRTDWHRSLGAAGAGLAILVLILGVTVAIQSGRTGGGGPQRNQTVFLIFPLTNISLFAGFCLFAVRARRRPQIHKRLMLLATLSLVVTPLARISRMAGLPFSPPAVGGMLLSDVVLVALLVFDWQTRGRPHKVTLAAGSLYLVSQPLRVLIGHTAAWQGLAHRMIG